MKLLPLILISFFGAAVLMVQLGERRNLTEQIQSHQDHETSLPRRASPEESGGLSPSEKQADLLSRLTEYRADSLAHPKRMPVNDLLEIISGATSEDLQALIGQIQKTLPSDNLESLASASLIQRLQRILDEMDPIAVLQTENRPEAFMALTRQSPDEALRWLERSSLSPEEREGFMGLFRKIRASKEPSRYLDHWDEISDSMVFSTFALLEPEGIADLMPVINLPENAEIREDLIASVIFSSLLEDTGLARSRVESLGLEAGEIIPILKSWDDLGSQETLEWAIDLGEDNPGQVLEIAEYFMADFAQHDLELAGEWLTKFEGSPVLKDQMIGRYAMILGSVNPEAALPWIETITNQENRASIRRSTLITWEIEDPQAFAEWQNR